MSEQTGSPNQHQRAVRPEFVDNLDGNTMANALRAHLEFLAESFAHPIDVAIATGYFNPEGFAAISEQLERTGRIRLLLGAEPIPPAARPVRHLGEPRGERFEAKLTR